mgnify:CR=1 FL=1
MRSVVCSHPKWKIRILCRVYICSRPQIHCLCIVFMCICNLEEGGENTPPWCIIYVYLLQGQIHCVFFLYFEGCFVCVYFPSRVRTCAVARAINKRRARMRTLDELQLEATWRRRYPHTVATRTSLSALRRTKGRLTKPHVPLCVLST